MDKFMFIYRGGDFTKLPPEEAQANMQQWFAWMDELKNDNRLISTGPLQPIGKQITGKRKMVTDGPFSEAKEIVGGYTIITAESLEEATKIAEGCPVLPADGMVEIRPLRDVMPR
ncbi:MAG TPA: YciI family protein [Chitinophagaceae bacterium]|nr:YciI family protein [Chitinophagaceae bacterium]